MKTIAILAGLALAAAPVVILAAEPAQPPRPVASPTPCTGMPQHQMGAMKDHQMHGNGAMPHQMPMQGGQMQGDMAGGGHGAMMMQGQAATAGHMAMPNGPMPCQASPSPSLEATPKGN